MSHLSDRREFLKRSTALGVGLAALPAWVRAGPADPDRRVRVAVIGTNSRGLNHLEAFAGIDHVEVAYVCDVSDPALAKGVQKAASFPGMQPKAEKDFRRILDDRSIDAVTIATPDHWHTPMTLLAMAAGKHVYVEKPCSQNPREGELLLQALAKSDRLVQMGNQRRSFPNMQLAAREIHGGIIGRAYYAKCWYENERGSIGVGKAAPVPAGLDYELWQGPAPRRPYRDNVIPYNWHWFWHWGTGEALNNGTHELDVCRWMLGVGFPTRVSSTGGRYQFQDDWQTPDTQVIGWEFGTEKAISWEGRSCNDYRTEGLSRGALIYGTEGTALVENNNYTVFDRKRRKVKEVVEPAEAEGTNTSSANGIRLDRLHLQNFVDAIRTGAALTSPIAEGHKSTCLLHLGNIAQRVGRSLACDPASGRIQHDDEAMQLWGRSYEPGWEPKV